MIWKLNKSIIKKWLAYHRQSINNSLVLSFLVYIRLSCTIHTGPDSPTWSLTSWLQKWLWFRQFPKWQKLSCFKNAQWELEIPQSPLAHALLIHSNPLAVSLSPAAVKETASCLQLRNNTALCSFSRPFRPCHMGGVQEPFHRRYLFTKVLVFRYNVML